MVQIFYSKADRIQATKSLSILRQITAKEALWLDIFDPDGEEKRAVEAFLGINLQSRATAEEIESSSRYSETDSAIFINTDFLIPETDNYSLESVSFILSGATFVSIRQVPLRTFSDIQRRMLANPRLYPTGHHILVGILENRIDLDADMIELTSREIAQYGRRVSQGENVENEFLLDINQLQENTMTVRENIIDKQRMISNLLKSGKTPKVINGKLSILLKDVNSLINHTDFSFERLEYLQNTVLGIINLDQNRIMKIFTLFSLLLMPPTLIASIYGMNMKLPLVGGNWDMLVVASVMVLTVVASIVIFRRRNMM